MRIGFTERGDGGLDLSWFEKVRDRNCDGLVVVTKNITPGCMDRLLQLHNSGFPVLLHAGITGLGEIDPPLELNTPPVVQSLSHIQDLIDLGFPKDRIVLRIDPVVPEGDYMEAPFHVLDQARKMGLLPGLRVRMSFMDNYPHVKVRCQDHIGRPLYHGKWQAETEDVVTFSSWLREYIKAGVISRVETCAEGKLLQRIPADLAAACYHMQGCISLEDIRLMGLDESKAPSDINIQNRTGCLCLACKYELLDRRHPCGNNCLYCYWKDE